MAACESPFFIVYRITVGNRWRGSGDLAFRVLNTFGDARVVSPRRANFWPVRLQISVAKPLVPQRPLRVDRESWIGGKADVHACRLSENLTVRFARVARVACSAGFNMEQSVEWLLCGTDEGRLLADSTGSRMAPES